MPTREKKKRKDDSGHRQYQRGLRGEKGNTLDSAAIHQSSRKRKKKKGRGEAMFRNALADYARTKEEGTSGRIHDGGLREGGKKEGGGRIFYRGKDGVDGEGRGKPEGTCMKC